MKTTNYNKLVRDKIPQIIEESGKTCVCEILSDEQYIKMLNEKLLEEVKEYLESGSVEELADIGEVMHAILAYKNVSIEEFQKVRLEKLEARGGFKDKILLKEIVSYNASANTEKYYLVANLIVQNENKIIDFMQQNYIDKYEEIQSLHMKCNIATDMSFQKRFASHYIMRYPSQEYRNTFFEVFEKIKQIESPSFQEVAKELININGRHEFSFITKMLHTINNNFPIYDSQVDTALGLGRKYVLNIDEKISQDVTILDNLQQIYYNIQTESLIDSTIDLFDKKF